CAKTKGATRPQIGKPVVTKPNTLPNEPGGVTERTIISRDGMVMPLAKPLSDAIRTSSSAPGSTNAMNVLAVPVTTNPAHATRLCRVVRPASVPPSKTPMALMVRSPVSAVLASGGGGPDARHSPNPKIWVGAPADKEHHDEKEKLEQIRRQQQHPPAVGGRPRRLFAAGLRRVCPMDDRRLSLHRQNHRRDDAEQRR